MRQLWVAGLVWAVVSAAAFAGDALMPFNAGGKWGFLAGDSNGGNFALAPAYELAYPFREGRAAVRQNKLWGFIDEKGVSVVPFQYDEVIKGVFRGGVAVVKKTGMFGVIDRDGKEVLPLKFKSVTLDEKEGRLIAVLPNAADPNDFFGLHGLYDLSGKMLMPHEYKQIYPQFKGGVTVVDKNGLRGLASSSGQLLAAPQYEQMLHSDISHFIALKEKGQVADVYDEHGKLRFSARYPYVGALVDNRAVFKDPATKLNGYLDGAGKIALAAQFVMAGTFSEGLAVVQRKIGGAVEVIDADGKSVGSAPNAFIRLDKYKNGHVWLADRTDKKVYLYNKRVEKVFPQGFHYAADFDTNGLALAQEAAKQNGLINMKGEWVLKPEWTMIEASSVPGQYIVTKEREKGIVTVTGQVIFKPQAVNIEKWDEQFVKIAPPGFVTGGEYHCMFRGDGVYFYKEKLGE